MPYAVQSTQMVGADPHATSAVPVMHIPSRVQQPPQDFTSQGAQQTTPMTCSPPPSGLHTS
jgi:hypothetical protein